MKKIKNIVILLLTAFIFSGCSVNGHSQNEYTKTLYCMDTIVMITVYAEDAEQIVNDLEKKVEDYEYQFSTEFEFAPTYELNRNGEGFLTDEGMKLLEASLSLYKETDGAFNVAIYPVMKEWGFLGEAKEFHVPSPESLREALAISNPEDIKINSENGEIAFDKADMAIDFGGIAKGYISQKLINYLEDTDAEWALLSLGGNIQVYGEKQSGKPWNIAILNPDDTNDYICSVQVDSGTAVVTSGGYQRNFEEDGVLYHHIVDPSTGYPANNGLKSVTIVTKDGMLADGLSTSIYIMGYEKGVEYWRANSDEFEMVIMTDDGQIWITEGLEKSYKKMDGFNYSIITR